MAKTVKKGRLGAAHMHKGAARKSAKPANARLVKKNVAVKKARMAARRLAKKPLKAAAAKPKAAKPAKIALKAGKAITIAPAAPAPLVKKEMSRELQDVIARANARHWLIELGGENTLEVIKNLPAVPSDEELAKKLKIKVSDVRASLNKLHNEGLVAYLRDKNSETGWYSYAWVLNEDRIKKWVGDKHSSHDAYRPQEGVEFYFCKDCGPESAIKFEVAHESSFKCPSCNSPLEFLDEEKFEQMKKLRESEK